MSTYSSMSIFTISKLLPQFADHSHKRDPSRFIQRQVGKPVWIDLEDVPWTCLCSKQSHSTCPVTLLLRNIIPLKPTAAHKLPLGHHHWYFLQAHLTFQIWLFPSIHPAKHVHHTNQRVKEPGNIRWLPKQLRDQIAKCKTFLLHLCLQNRIPRATCASNISFDLFLIQHGNLLQIQNHFFEPDRPEPFFNVPALDPDWFVSYHCFISVQ